MQFTNILSDDSVMEELGRRIAAIRVARQLTQAQLAEEAGVSKRTVERLEDGESTQLTNLVRCLRALDKLEGLERLFPETPANPVELLRGRGTPRSRVRSSAAKKSESSQTASPQGSSLSPGWIWGDKK